LVDAIVMAAGEGRRLRPVTERWPKPVLPIDGRPMIATLLHELRRADCGRVTVVIGHLADRVERLLGDGSAYGVELQYAHQPRADGSADAVARALVAGAEPPALVVVADTVYRPGDLGGFADAFANSGVPGALAVRERPPTWGVGVDVQDGLVTAIGGEAGPFVHAALWGLGPQLSPYLSDLVGPPYELADAFRRAIADGLSIAAFEVGPTRDLTDALDLVLENFVYLSGGR
jgi:UDP-N-acetylglucosamine diphosphorylase / glucose-1-phosphate thymidylyltransferase / UDP-N-acetylgalactosamine diphosphorylase / glucosamine-1-phosphate N-acetyltransferase / galactosamine-1-phosphate N-acetyltransferase